jgi:allophanate hydrolase
VNENLSLDIATLRAAYADGTATPEAVVCEVLRRSARHRDRNAWISLRGEAELLADARALRDRDAATLPLYGIPFGIKDNIDLAGLPTTAACPDFAYTPTRSAFVVERLMAAGAIPIGKTNMDQFATGLSGTRVPDAYGICRNSFKPEYIAGGSSSGSAVAVALGMASFALGTDTAGSGRVPAAFNNLIGLKPTRGLLSARGVVPACRTLDCVSILALTAADAATVFGTLAVFDPEDPCARRVPPIVAVSARVRHAPFRFGVPRENQLEFFGDVEAADLFAQAIRALTAIGGEPVAVDISAFLRAARLLYEGPWVAERYAAIRSFIEERPGSLHPVTRQIIEPSRSHSAVEAFEAQYALQALRREAEGVLAEIDVFLTLTAPTFYRVDELLEDPIRLNSNLGYYTNFMNLLDLAAVAVPAGFYGNGLPFGITLCADAGSDEYLLRIAQRLQQSLRLPLGATGIPCPIAELPAPVAEVIPIVVCGAHMSGLPLNHQLTELGATLKAQCKTAPCYRLHALTAFSPPRPGLIRDEVSGTSIEVEVWDLPAEQLGALFRQIPSPLSLGRVELANGSCECGFLCEPFALAGAPDISVLGSWRTYLARKC